MRKDSFAFVYFFRIDLDFVSLVFEWRVAVLGKFEGIFEIKSNYSMFNIQSLKI
jgi:hypothetical protein